MNQSVFTDRKRWIIRKTPLSGDADPDSGEQSSRLFPVEVSAQLCTQGFVINLRLS